MHTILLVEDNEWNRDMLTRRLGRAGFRVVEAADGPTALEAAASSAPDLILLDVALGEMSGWEVAERLKLSGQSAPIIALTAHATSADRAKSIELGCADFDTKPVDLPRLLLKIETHLRKA